MIPRIHCMIMCSFIWRTPFMLHRRPAGAPVTLFSSSIVYPVGQQFAMVTLYKLTKVILIFSTFPLFCTCCVHDCRCQAHSSRQASSIVSAENRNSPSWE